MHKLRINKSSAKTDGSSEFWIISVPTIVSPEASFKELMAATQTSSSCYSYNYHVPLPGLQVGTLDQLVGLADDLQKTDSFAERISRKLFTYFETVLDQDKGSLSENLVVGNNYDPFSYVTKFNWDSARFPIRLSLQSLNQMILKRTGQIESELKSRSAAFDSINQKIQAELKSQRGNLLTRDISDIVKESDFIIGSEIMKTILVCVPKNSYHLWHDSYETLDSMVAPRSSRLLFDDDNDYGLFSCIIFRKIEDSFTYACKQKGFYVKPFEYDRKEIENKANKVKTLEANKANLFGPLIRWLKINFSEAFIDWIHVKVLRVFVESVLRYGLPVNFQLFLLQPNVKSVIKLKDVLDKLYSKIGNGPPTLSKQHNDDNEIDLSMLEGLMSVEDYHPYVMFTINLSFITSGDHHRS